MEKEFKIILVFILLVVSFRVVSAVDNQTCRNQLDACTTLSQTCCEGLVPAKSGFINNYSGCEYNKCGTICIPCGNGVCDDGENKCNCAVDCNRNQYNLGNNVYNQTQITEQNKTQTCAKEGEEISSHPQSGALCCANLDRISPVTQLDSKGECIPDNSAGGVLCSDCGNGVCESWENKCNCNADCKEKEAPIQDKTCTIANETYTAELKCCSGLRADKDTSTCIMEGKKTGWFKNMLGWFGRLFGKK